MLKILKHTDCKSLSDVEEFWLKRKLTKCRIKKKFSPSNSINCGGNNVLGKTTIERRIAQLLTYSNSKVDGNTLNTKNSYAEGHEINKLKIIKSSLNIQQCGLSDHVNVASNSIQDSSTTDNQMQYPAKMKGTFPNGDVCPPYISNLNSDDTDYKCKSKRKTPLKPSRSLKLQDISLPSPSIISDTVRKLSQTANADVEDGVPSTSLSGKQLVEIANKESAGIISQQISPLAVSPYPCHLEKSLSAQRLVNETVSPMMNVLKQSRKEERENKPLKPIPSYISSLASNRQEVTGKIY